MAFGSIKSLFSGGNASGPAVSVMAAATAVQFQDDADTIFVDVRNADEIAASGTVKGAVRAPLPQFPEHAKSDGSGLLPAIDTNKRIICICASGMRSSNAAQQLIGLGYIEVGNVRGGFGAWKQANGKTER